MAVQWVIWWQVTEAFREGFRILTSDTVLPPLTEGCAFIEPGIQTPPVTVCLHLKTAYTEKYTVAYFLSCKESPEGILSCLLSLLETSPAFVIPSPTLTSSAFLMKSTDLSISRHLITKTTCLIEEDNWFLSLSSLHPPPKPRRRCFLLGWRTKYFTSLLLICACPVSSGSQKYEESVSHQS